MGRGRAGKGREGQGRAGVRVPSLTIGRERGKCV